MPMTLTEFLLARIAEDEARDQRKGEYLRSVYVGDTRADLRAKAECEAKRRIVERYEQVDRFIRNLEIRSDAGGMNTQQSASVAIHHAELIQQRDALTFSASALAAVYADHPDYQQEWKP